MKKLVSIVNVVLWSAILWGCGGSTVAGRSGGTLPMSAVKAVPENPIATPTPELFDPPVFIKELVIDTSLGKTKLEIYQGMKGSSPVKGFLGSLTVISEKTTYPNLNQSPLQPMVESHQRELNYPVYWASVGVGEIGLVTFVDQAVSASMITPRRILKEFDVQPPGHRYCSREHFRGMDFLSPDGQKKYCQQGGFNVDPCEPNDFSCQYNFSTEEESCQMPISNAFARNFHVDEKFSVDNRVLVEQEKNAFACVEWNPGLPPTQHYVETQVLTRLHVDFSAESNQAELSQDRSDLVPGTGKPKTVSFSEPSLDFKL